MQALTTLISEPKHKHKDRVKPFYTSVGVCGCACLKTLQKLSLRGHWHVGTHRARCQCWHAVSHQLVTRPCCVSPNLTPGVSCCDAHFNCRITAEDLAMWAQLGSGGLNTSSLLWVIWRRPALRAGAGLGLVKVAEDQQGKITSKKQHKRTVLTK